MRPSHRERTGRRAGVRSRGRSVRRACVPAGTARVSYFVTGIRSTTRGATAQFDVNFGVEGPGLAVVDVTANAVKMAA